MNLGCAVEAIERRVGEVMGVSSVMETKAVGYDGADYLNCVVAVRTALEPEALLRAVKGIERAMGRTRDTRAAGRYEDRVIDIDIITYGMVRMESETLTIPHPRAAEREFVMRPLNELKQKLNIQTPFDTTMKVEQAIQPDWIFETSWEVCNRVGGIYTVLSTKAETLHSMYGDHLVFVGPDVWTEDVRSPFFKEEKTPLDAWKPIAMKEGLQVRIGRWQVPGAPICVLVDHHPFMEAETLNRLYGTAWELYGVDSLHGYGDYAESTAFAVSAGKVMVSLHDWIKSKKDGEKFIAHFNEWMLGMGELVVKSLAPDMATVFTTHATSIGRSIAGNGKPLYGQLQNYNGDQMADELNMQSKHSIEKIAAREADCFTTVSDVTDRECAQLLEKAADVVTPNGFENGFVPRTAAAFSKKRKAAREKLADVVECLTGVRPSENALYLGTCGRCEFKNKGIDLFLDSLNSLSHRELRREVIGFVMVPGWVAGPRADLQSALSELEARRKAKKKAEKTGKETGKSAKSGDNADEMMQPAALPNNIVTHHLHQSGNDAILRAIQWYGFRNRPESKVKVVYVPCYLNGDDGIFNKDYYDMLIGLDLTAFPSYYEPWGYTPLESVAFSIPTITTDLSGFGQWVNSTAGAKESGVYVVRRTDDNYYEVRDAITDKLFQFLSFTPKHVEQLREAAKATSQRALWEKFIAYYVKTYTFALSKAAERNATAE